MTLEEAKKFRDENLDLIGSSVDDSTVQIISIIVTPQDKFEAFIQIYRDKRDKMSNDIMIDLFPSKDYGVLAILSPVISSDDLLAEDLGSIKARISAMSKKNPK